MKPETSRNQVIIFMCGDVMTGRGIDQALPHPGTARIHESYMKDAGGYVMLAEQANGPIPRPVDFSYIWGDALGLMYFATVDPPARSLISLRMTPTQIKRFRINRASDSDARQLGDILNREGKRFGTRVVLDGNNILTLQWH